MAWLIRSVALMGTTLIACLSAQASDLPSAAPPPPPLAPALPLADNWSGPWIGVYGGYSFANPNGSFSVVGDPADVTPAVQSTVNPVGAGQVGARGALGGVQGGWNLRLNTDYVVGLEADVSYSGMRGSRNGSGAIDFSSQGLPNVPFSINSQVTSDWQAALRARAGYLFTPQLLAFIDIGPAIGHFKYSGGYIDTVPWANLVNPALPAGYNELENASGSKVVVGLTLGGGLEYALGNNLTLRAEYQWTRFPSITMIGTSNNLLPVPTPGTVTHNSGTLSTNTFKVGVNYYFH